MEGKTHRTFGVIAMEVALISAGVPPGWESAISMGIAAVAAYGPDLDTSKSTVSESVPGVGIAGHFVAHRTVTHSILMTAVIWLLLTHTQVAWYVLAGVIMGWGSHWFIDTFNKEGVQLLWPIPVWFKFLPEEIGVETGSEVEKMIRHILMFIEMVILWLYYSQLVLSHITALPFAWHLEVWAKRILGFINWPLFGSVLHVVLHMP